MTPVTASHIWLDDQARAWIDDTNVKVIEVVLDKIGLGLSSEEIYTEYPELSLAQIHAALAYYYDHQAEFDAEMERQREEHAKHLQAQGKDTPLHRRLRGKGLLP